MKKSLLFLISIFSLCFLSACSRGGGSTQPVPTHFSVTAPATTIAGTTFQITVTALDASNNVVASYSGTVHFTSTDAHAELPANSMLANGSGPFSAMLETAGGQTFTATDTATASITGTSSPINVSAAAPSKFSVQVPASTTVGTAFNFTVTAEDPFSNSATAYSGTVQFASTDAQAVFSANPASIANGVGTFQATLKTVGGQTITVTDKVKASMTGTSNAIGVFAVHCQSQGQECFPGHNCCPGLICLVEGGPRAFCEVNGFSPNGSQASEKAPHFTAACTMETARESHTATLLSSGLVLIAGGGDRSVILATAELFNPASRTFAPTGNMISARARHTATLLRNGTVLVTGGRDASDNVLATAELFNSSSMSFTPTGGMSTARESHTATLLSDGKVLITGGKDATGSLATAELFDPTSGSFTPTGSMQIERQFHTATLLKNGKVLVTGGRDADGNVLTTAELFDPSSGVFVPTGSLHAAREFHTATLLSDGRVLITGGDDGKVTLPTAELFDPTSGSFTPTGSMHAVREFHTATLRSDGTVLVAGGAEFTPEVDGSGQAVFLLEPTATAEVFDPASGSFRSVGDMANARARHAAVLLLDGEVLVTGGINNSTRADSLASAELFQ
jgi:WD40 repeat protein